MVNLKDVISSVEFQIFLHKKRWKDFKSAEDILEKYEDDGIEEYENVKKILERAIQTNGGSLAVDAHTFQSYMKEKLERDYIGYLIITHSNGFHPDENVLEMNNLDFNTYLEYRSKYFRYEFLKCSYPFLKVFANSIKKEEI